MLGHVDRKTRLSTNKQFFKFLPRGSLQALPRRKANGTPSPGAAAKKPRKADEDGDGDVIVVDLKGVRAAAAATTPTKAGSVHVSPRITKTDPTTGKAAPSHALVPVPVLAAAEEEEEAADVVQDSDRRDDSNGDELNEYERERLANIERNRQFLLGLGLEPAVAPRTSPFGGSSSAHKRVRATVAPGWIGADVAGMDDGALLMSTGTPRRLRTPPEHRLMQRQLKGDSGSAVKRSRRLAGEAAPPVDDNIEDIEKLSEARTAVERPRVAEAGDTLDETMRYSHVLWMGTRQTTRQSEPFIVPAEIRVPLTLLSIGTSILELGRLITDDTKHYYWSHKTAMFRHPYPVGYRAVKCHFNTRFVMSIHASPDGPIFEVHQEGGPTWHGTTPTAPWTEACLKCQSKKTRVSGPLFFGFSDPITQKLIEGLPGYEPWSVVQGYVEQVQHEQKLKRQQEQEQQEQQPGSEANDE